MAVLPAHAAAESHLDRIRERGTLVVGVKTEYPPFGMLDANGRIVGLEPELAADLARRLHVKLRLVGVTTANRLQKLVDGSIDVLIATLGDTAKRREIATLIEPDYYASGVSIMTPKTRKLADWAAVRGKTLCATQGAYFNRPMAERYLLDLRMYNGTRDAMLALRDGRCAGWLYDDTAISSVLALPDWQNYAMPLPSMLLSPWAIAIAPGEAGGALDHAIGDAVADWHRSGLLIALERKWKLQPSAYLAHAHALWSERTKSGAYVCTRTKDGNWPAECRDKTRVGAENAGGLERLGARVEALTGLDFSIVYDGYDRAEFLYGLLTSIGLVVSCVLGSVLVAMLGAMLLDAGVPLLSPFVAATVTVARMTPPLLQIYVVVFGLGGVMVRWGLSLNAFLACVLCLSLYAGSACAVALTGAADLVRRRTPEFRIVLRTLPVVFRLAYQPVVAALVNIVKATGLASAVAVPELISSSTAIIAERGNAVVMMNVLMVVYFLMVLLVVRFFSRLHRRFVHHASA
jgi:polar amino acid transport system substrate-binding protein